MADVRGTSANIVLGQSLMESAIRKSAARDVKANKPSELPWDAPIVIILALHKFC